MSSKVDDIAPGSQISVKVTKRPTNASATKTIVRVLSKDEGVAAQNKKLAKIRREQYSPRMRGGRLYSGRQVKLRRIKGEMGEAGTVIATVDVLRDLKSVEKFVELSSA